MRRPLLFVSLISALMLLLTTLGCGSSSSSGGGTLPARDVPATTPDTSGGVDASGGCAVDADCADAFADLGPCERAACGDDGSCVRTSAPEGTLCDDADLCTLSSWCRSGQCTGAFELDCDDGDPCTRDACDGAAGGCQHSALDGVPCDDGDPCTNNDRCETGACVGTFSDTCACTEDADCAPLDDGDLCNGVLVCRDGGCHVDPASIVRCDTTGDRTCAPTTCEPATGICAPTPAPDGAPCEDGNGCTDGDTCQAGRCAGGDYVCEACDAKTDCAPFDDADLCNGTLACVDGVCVIDELSVVTCEGAAGPCLTSVCQPDTGTCAGVARADASPCDDGSVCTLRDYCLDGSCEGGGELACDDGDPCTDDTCDAVDGCVFTPASGAACDDGDVCTEGDVCADGVCGGSVVSCDDDDVCTTDSCVPATGCVHDELPDCRCVTASDCDDDDPCTVDACDAEGAFCTHAVAADGARCGDAEDACHDERVCAAGACVTGAEIVCDDGISCTDDTCEPATGCVFTPTDRCGCVTDTDCDDSNVCTYDTCEPATYTCSYAPGPSGAGCDDADACTRGDTCDDAGHCVPGAPIDCSDGDDCTQDVCDPVSGCANPDEPDDTGCDDHDDCTVGDTCQGGVCVSGTNTCVPELCDDTVDNDQDGLTDCDDDECDAAAICHDLDCDDGLDTDGDGLTDCDDPDCAADPWCMPEGDCGDGVDDDQDGATDCDDPGCAAEALCSREDDCEDGVDNDEDGFTDCDDLGCIGTAWCLPEDDCEDGADDDGDGAADCDDPGCVHTTYCLGEISCTNTFDDDGDGYTDCDDPGCQDGPLCSAEADCGDGADDDGDGLTDCDDPGCDGTPACTPEVDCDDGVDNDLDGDTDCWDEDCEALPQCRVLCDDAVRVIHCGDTLSADNTGLRGRVDGYDCAPWNEPGGEVVFSFQTPPDILLATATLTETGGATHDIFVLGDGCDAESCLAADSIAVSFGPSADTTYYLVVDGYDFAPEGAFELTLDCAFEPVVELVCDDDSDNDGDGQTDCDDSDCASADVCQGPPCTAITTLGCGDVVAGTTIGGPTRIDAYDCAGGLAAQGPETAYAFVAPAGAEVHVRIEPDGGGDPDLYLLSESCDPESCFDFGAFVGGEDLRFSAAAGTTYYLVVDSYAPADAGPFRLAVSCGCEDDVYEDNDTVFTSTTTDIDPTDGGSFAATGLRSCNADDDIFAFEMCEGAVATVSVTYAVSEGNIDIAVFSPSYQTVVEDAGTANDASLQFTASSEGTYYLQVYLNPDAGLVDGNDYDLQLDVDTLGCAPPAGLCDAPIPIACGDAVTGDNTGLDSLQDQYIGCATWMETGGERVYAFTAPRAMTGVEATLTADAADHDLWILGDACDPDACREHGDTSATFDVEAGELVYVVVDGHQSNPAGTFALSLACPVPPEICDNLQDDDGDTLQDCDDPDCVDAPNCIETCSSGLTLACGETDTWTTVDAGNSIGSYSCAPGVDAGASDFAYAFTPDADTRVTVTLVSNTAGVNLDLYVLEAACAANTCVAHGSTVDDAGEIVAFDGVAGVTYFLVVDGPAGEEGDYDILVECGEATSLCAGASPIACGEEVAGDNTGLVSLVTTYGCSTFNEPGGEVVYSFTAPADLAAVNVSLSSGDGADHDLFLLPSACDESQCLDYFDRNGSFAVTAGTRYFLVVDGYTLDPEGPFTLSVTCPGAPEICDDGLDNDTDGDTDCADAECVGAEGCVELNCADSVDDDGDSLTDCDDPDCTGTASCPTDCDAYVTECGIAEDWTTEYSTNTLSVYACAGGTADGPDYAYSLTVDVPTIIDVTLSSTTGDPDLYVLEGLCNGSACVGASVTMGDESYQFTAEAGVPYYLVVETPAGPESFSFALACSAP